MMKQGIAAEGLRMFFASVLFVCWFSGPERALVPYILPNAQRKYTANEGTLQVARLQQVPVSESTLCRRSR